MTEPTITERLRRCYTDTPAYSLRMEAANEVEKLRAALIAAKAEIEWWADEHGCCEGHQHEVIAVIDAALTPSNDDGTKTPPSA